MYRIIACDLDETLLDDTGSVPPRVRTAVADTRERGARFVPMLRTAGLGVAVANASDEAKAAADYVCTPDNTAGGVAEALEKFVLDA